MGYDELHWVINKMKEGGFKLNVRKSLICNSLPFTIIYRWVTKARCHYEVDILKSIRNYVIMRINSDATPNYTTLPTTRPCGELWLVEG